MSARSDRVLTAWALGWRPRRQLTVRLDERSHVMLHADGSCEWYRDGGRRGWYRDHVRVEPT